MTRRSVINSIILYTSILFAKWKKLSELVIIQPREVNNGISERWLKLAPESTSSDRVEWQF